VFGGGGTQHKEGHRTFQGCSQGFPVAHRNFHLRTNRQTLNNSTLYRSGRGPGGGRRGHYSHTRNAAARRVKHTKEGQWREKKGKGVSNTGGRAVSLTSPLFTTRLGGKRTDDETLSKKQTRKRGTKGHRRKSPQRKGRRVI